MTTKQSRSDKSPYAWAALRISLGAVFLWAFADKLLGLGFATCRDAGTNAVTTFCDKAWIGGGSPTSGFLEHATKGPFADFYQSLAGNGLVDVLFMAGLLLIGLALVSGAGVKIATAGGVVLMAMMWSAVLPPENNPVLDDHVVYALVLIGLNLSNGTQQWGLRGWWIKQSLVKRFSVLE